MYLLSYFKADTQYPTVKVPVKSCTKKVITLYELKKKHNYDPTPL